MANIDNLNFKIILDDQEFNKRVSDDMKVAQQLNAQLSELLRIKAQGIKISAQDAASAKRASDIRAKQLIDEERIAQAKAKTALEEEKVYTQMQKTQREAALTKAAIEGAATQSQRLATEVKKTEAAEKAVALQAQKLATEKLRTAAAAQRLLNQTERTTNATSRLSSETRKTSDNLDRAKNSATSLSSVLGKYLTVYSFANIVSSLVRITGEFEMQKTTLSAMLQDLNAAEDVIGRIKSLAIESPFTFKDLSGYAKQLTAYSIPQDELFETTKMIADLSAGLGVAADRLILAYGQVKSAAFLRGQEVRQFTEAGIPILQALAEEFYKVEGAAVSVGEVFDRIANRQVSFEMVSKVLHEMTAAGGKFYNMQKIQAESLRGKISNLTDAYEMMLNEIGSKQSDKIKNLVDWTRKLMLNYKEVGKNIASAVVAFGVYRTALIATELATSTFVLENHKLLQGLVNIAKWATRNPYAGLASALGVIASLTYKVFTSQSTLDKSYGVVQNAVKNYNESIRQETNLLDYLLDRLQDLTVGTMEYEAIKNQIVENYGTYLTDVEKEKLAIGALADVYDTLKEKIIAANREKAIREGNDELTTLYTTQYNNIFSNFDATIKALNIQDKRIRQALSDYVRGEIQFENLPEEAKAAINKTKEIIAAKANTIGGQFGNGIVFNGYDFDVLKEYLTNLEDAIDESRKRLSEDLDVMFGPLPAKKAAQFVTGWRKIVQDELTKMGLDKDTSFGLWAEDTTKSTDYVEDMVKRYKELKKEMEWVSTFDDAQLARLEKNKVAIETIAAALNIDIKALAENGGGGDGVSPEEKRLKRLIETLRKLQDQYERLKEVDASDESIKNLFKSLYPDIVEEQGEQFLTDLNYLERAIELAEELKKINPEAGKSLLVTLGGDEFSTVYNDLKRQKKAYEDTAKAIEKYFSMLQEWESEDFDLHGKGIILDISKIASDFKQELNEISLRENEMKSLLANIDLDSEEKIGRVREIFVKEFGEDLWNSFWASYTKDGEKAIETLSLKQQEYAKKLAQEKVDDLAKKYVSESYFNNNIDLSHLSEKTFFQIRELRKRVEDILTKEPLDIPVYVKTYLSDKGVNIDQLKDIDLESIFEGAGKNISEADRDLLRLIQKIQKAELSTEDFGNAIKKVIGGDFKRLTQEEAQALMTMVKGFMSEMNKLMSSISKYADAVGNDKLKGVVDGLSQSINILGSLADKVAKGDYVGAALTFFTSMATVILDAAAAQQALNAEIEKTRLEMELLNSQKRIARDVNSIFGIDEYKEFKNAYSEAVDAHAKALADIEKQNQKFYGSGKDNWGQAGIAGSLAGGAGLGALIGSFVPVIGTAIGAGVGALVGMVVGLIGAGVTEANDYAKTLEQMAKEIGVDLIDEKTGLFDSESLKKIRETYADLDKDSSQMLDRLIANAEKFENAIESMAVYMNDILGACAEDMAKAFVDSFKKSGEAALDYADIMDEVATMIAQSVIKSSILQNVFSDEDAKKMATLIAIGDQAGALAILDEAMQAAQNLAPHFQEFLESLKPYFNMEGQAQSLGNGIKGITEDTANLLASYLNAIRADVSYSKSLWERMDATTRQIAAMLAGLSAPTLMQYQAQIAANTYDTSMNTQAIMSDLRSVLTSEGGITAIRTYS